LHVHTDDAVELIAVTALELETPSAVYKLVVHNSMTRNPAAKIAKDPSFGLLSSSSSLSSSFIYLFYLFIY